MPTLSTSMSPLTTTSLGSFSSSPKTSTPGGFVLIRSPTSPMEPNPLHAANIADITDRESGVSPHAFRAPTESDSRGPCPALNTLANHGYLPRDGQNITRKQFLDALQNPETYHLSNPLAKLLVHGGFVLMHELTASSLSLHDLAIHGLIEHNASLVHKDTQSGHTFAPTRCDTKLLDDLLPDDFLTLDMVARRREELERVAPLDPMHQEVARGEWALVLDIFGREHGGKLPVDELRVWFKQNRFPKGWKPSHEQGLLATMSEASELRNEMNKLRKDYENSQALAALERSHAHGGADV